MLKTAIGDAQSRHSANDRSYGSIRLQKYAAGKRDTRYIIPDAQSYDARRGTHDRRRFESVEVGHCPHAASGENRAMVFDSISCRR